MSEPVQLRNEGNIFILTLNNGSNNFTLDFIRQINEKLDIVEKSTGPACLITTSSHEKIFSSGLNTAYMSTLQPLETFYFIKEFLKLVGRLLVFPVPTVAAVNGHAIAGGMALALAHDFRIMREDLGMFGMSEVNIGMNLPPGFVTILQAKLNPRVVSESAITGRYYKSKECLEYGIVDRLEKKENLLNAAIELAKKLAIKGQDRLILGDIKMTLYKNHYDILTRDSMTDMSMFVVHRMIDMARPRL
eukprot:TRINITY_DN4860_c0_g5_i1.p1 TRINITY_DN4860_c0_g5~~TRINITY_DN4860_c0_g5_i1.p1  ORF type:complete len:247 (+),score=71.16 TRINITY_DN4860_c0_g5_i1:133-873(+)